MTEKKEIIPIEKRTSKILATTVISFRVLGINRDDSIKAMMELNRRKKAGDDFDYDSYIKEKVQDIPASNLGETGVQDIIEMMKNVKSGNF